VILKIRAATAAGVDWIQIREKDLPGRELLPLVRAAVTSASHEELSARVLVNDRLDVALGAGASGVHLGGESLPVAEAVRWCRHGNAPAGFLIGASCHNLQEIRDAEHAGASYVFFGPIFATPSKEHFGTPQGTEMLSRVCRQAQIPVIAIGGVSEENAAQCIRAGAAGVAAIRMFQEAGDANDIRATLTRLHVVG
jgi:thiamine-phosphate pyrophosphorylase